MTDLNCHQRCLVVAAPEGEVLEWDALVGGIVREGERLSMHKRNKSMLFTSCACELRISTYYYDVPVPYNLKFWNKFVFEKLKSGSSVNYDRLIRIRMKKCGCSLTCRRGCGLCTQARRSSCRMICGSGAWADPTCRRTRVDPGPRDPLEMATIRRSKW